MSLTPIFVSAVTGYLLYRGAIIQPLIEVASEQRNILQPLQNMQLSLWDVSESVIDFAANGEARRKIAYQKEALQINADFANLSVAMEDQGSMSPMSMRLRMNGESYLHFQAQFCQASICAVMPWLARRSKNSKRLLAA